jgi:hypothetical protein
MIGIGHCDYRPFPLLTPGVTDDFWSKHYKPSDDYPLFVVLTPVVSDDFWSKHDGRK